MAGSYPNATNATLNFKWSELLRGQTAPASIRNALFLLASATLEPLRAKIASVVGANRAGIRINSGYRSPERNAATAGSSSTSQHMTGEAVDLAALNMSSLDVVTLLWNSPEIPVDQVILYAPERGGHVHVSYTVKRRNRRQFLYAPAGSTGYVAWSPGSSGSGGSGVAPSGGGKAPTSSPSTPTAPATPKAATPFDAAVDASRKGLIWQPGTVGAVGLVVGLLGAAYILLRGT